MMTQILALIEDFEENKGKLPFFFKLFHTTINNNLKQGKQGYRYPPSVIAFSRTLRFAGGKQVIDLMNGIPGSKDDMIPNINDVVVGLPTPSTQIRHTRPVCYTYGFNENSELLLSGIPEKERSSCEFLLLADEIKVNEGYIHVGGVGLIGGTEFIPEKGAKDLKEDFLQQNMAKYVLQVFLCSTNGKFCLPLCFYPTSKANASTTADIFVSLAKKLEIQYNIKIVLGSTDGFLSASFDEKINDLLSATEELSWK